MNSLDTTIKSGKVAIDAAVKACSSFGNLKSVVTQLISDCQSATNAEAFLKEKCGINLCNTDTGAITGKDAGGSKAKTAESIVPESGKASYPSGTSFTKRGLKVIVPNKSTLTTAQQIVVQGLYSWWIDSALNLIEQSYSYSFKDKDATVKEITLEFVNEPDSDIMAYVTPNLSSTDGSAYKADALTLTVNMSRFNNITADEVNGSAETYPFYLDRVLAHELTHAIMAAKIDNFQDMPTFITEGMAELTHGIDDTRASDIEELAANPSQLETLLNSNAEPSNLDYAAGYIFLRYLTKQVSEGNDTIPAVADDEFIENTVDGATIQTSSGNDEIYNSGNNVSINGGDGHNKIYNYGDGFNAVTISDVTIKTGAGKDFISNFYAKKTKINSGAGNDTIHNGWYGDYATIDTGNGNDYVYNGIYSTNSKIILGAGNDTLVNVSSERVTVNGGKGNDLIEFDIDSTRSLIKYKVGDGNDTISGYNISDTISLTGGSVTSTSISGDNLILNIDSGSMTFIDALTVNVNGKFYGKSSKKGTNGKDYIVNIDSNETIKAYKGNDTIANYGNNVLINAGNGKNYVQNYGQNAIILTGNGNNNIFTDEYSKIVSGNGKDYISTGWAGSIIEAGGGNDTIVNQGISVLMGGNGNDVIIDQGHPYSTINGGKGNDTIYNSTGWDGEEIIEYTTGDGNDVVYGYNSNSTIKIFGKYKTSTVGNDVVVKVGTGSILLKDAVGEKINILNTESLLIKGTNGTDTIENYFSNATIQALGGNDYIYNYYGGDNVTINAGIGDDTIENWSDSVTIDGGAGNDSIYNYGSDVTLDGGKDDDFIHNICGYNVSINGGDGKDSIINDSTVEAAIDGGNGNDYIFTYSDASIRGGRGNDTISLDYSSYNLIQYSSGDGKDLIQGFNSTSTLSIGGGSYSTTKNGSDIIVTVGKGKITLEGAASLDKVNIKGTKATSTTLAVTDKTKSPVTIGSAIKTVNASKRTKAIKITGNKLDNTISGGSKNDSLYGGKGNDSILGNAGNDKLYGQAGNDILKGGAGNDSLWGGKGNDSLWGGSGKDTFIYSDDDGKDVIYGFADNDLLKITGAFSATYSKSKDEVYFKIGDTSKAITLKDFSATSFNVNGTNYKIKGSKLK